MVLALRRRLRGKVFGIVAPNNEKNNDKSF